jgi:metal-responsive CopG/Arc/MetJ family transcriptional regulator
VAKIKIEKSLFERVQETAKRAGYSSADEFVTHLLEKAVTDVEQAATDEEVEKQLRGLGYIE